MDNSIVCFIDGGSGSGRSSGSGNGGNMDFLQCFYQQAINRSTDLENYCDSANITTVSVKDETKCSLHGLLTPGFIYFVACSQLCEKGHDAWLMSVKQLESP